MNKKNLLESIIDEKLEQKRLNEIRQLVKEYDSLDSVLIENKSYDRDVQIVVRLDELGAFDNVINEKGKGANSPARQARAARRAKLQATRLNPDARNAIAPGVSVEPSPAETPSTEEPTDTTTPTSAGDEEPDVQANVDSERRAQKQAELEKTFSRGSMFKFKVGQLAKMLGSAVKSGKTKLVAKIKAAINKVRGKKPDAPVSDVPEVPKDVAAQVDNTPAQASAEPETGERDLFGGTSTPEPTKKDTEEPEASTDTSSDPDQTSLDFDKPVEEPKIEPAVDTEQEPKETPADTPSVAQQAFDKTKERLGLNPEPAEEPKAEPAAEEPKSEPVTQKPAEEPKATSKKSKTTKGDKPANIEPTPEKPAASSPTPAVPTVGGIGTPSSTGVAGTSTPVKFTPTSTTAAQKPEEPVKTAEPTKTTEPTKVAEPTKTTEPTKVAEPTKTTEPVKAAEPTMTEPKKPIQPWSTQGRELRAQQRATMSPEEKAREKERSMRRMGFRPEPRGVGDRLKSAWKAFTAKPGDSVDIKQGYRSVFAEIQRLMEQLQMVEHILATESVQESLVGGQKNLDVAPPYGQLTAADFAKLRRRRNEIRSVLAEQIIREELYKHNVTLAELNPHQRTALMETVKRRSNTMWEMMAEMRMNENATEN